MYALIPILKYIWVKLERLPSDLKMHPSLLFLYASGGPLVGPPPKFFGHIRIEFHNKYVLILELDRPKNLDVNTFVHKFFDEFSHLVKPKKVRVKTWGFFMKSWWIWTSSWSSWWNVLWSLSSYIVCNKLIKFYLTKMIPYQI